VIVGQALDWGFGGISVSLAYHLQCRTLADLLYGYEACRPFISRAEATSPEKHAILQASLFSTSAVSPSLLLSALTGSDNLISHIFHPLS
jgi:hypothetical protein